MARGGVFVAMGCCHGRRSGRSTARWRPDERAPHRDRIGELEIAAVRDAAGDARHASRRAAPSSRFSRSAVASPSTLGGVATMTSVTPSLADALDQLAERQILRADALERREQPPEHEVAPAHRPGALDRHEVVHARHDAEQLRVALGVARTRRTRAWPSRDLGDVPAALARAELVAQRAPAPRPSSRESDSSAVRSHRT